MFSLLFSDFLFGQELVILPAKGQINDQIEKDKYDGYTWAKQGKGFYPMQAQQVSQTARAQPQGSTPERVKEQREARQAA